MSNQGFFSVLMTITMGLFVSLESSANYKFKVAQSTKLNSGVVLTESDLQKIVQARAKYLNTKVAEDKAMFQSLKNQQEKIFDTYKATIENGWNKSGVSVKTVAEDLKNLEISEQANPKNIPIKFNEKYGLIINDFVKKMNMSPLVVANQLLKINPPHNNAKRILPILDPAGYLFNSFIGAGWYYDIFNNPPPPPPPPPTNIMHDFNAFSIVGRSGGSGLPETSGRSSQWSYSVIASVITVTSLLANIIDSDPRTRRIRAEAEFSEVWYRMAASGALGFADAGSRVRLTVLDGTTRLCSSEYTISWLTAVLGANQYEGEIPSIPLNCTFDNPSAGLSVRLVVLAELITWNGAGGLGSLSQSELITGNVDMKIFEIF